ncbi:MAG: hypothetical protein F6K22_10575 [Okeania sp. SIO2F4]|uniref:hypothetical protein n=1 Tax=Okeania sp. SIO2F4 TaxID=2607790 RepID=UPI00142CACEB|nr:hypothetical protein [Okeania sp. SIO2F4]NES03254.1 hypothetical protein [Okeania sp. SIO2F4]
MSGSLGSLGSLVRVVRVVRVGSLVRVGVFFNLDLRSLALFRVGSALIIIVDLIQRFPDIKAHYTDFGILPRGPLIEQFLNPWLWSLHLFSGNVLFQGLLFTVAFICAIALLVGYRTQLFTILSWVLLAYLHSRNNIILNAGDYELRLLLFWGIFLPKNWV